MMRLIGWAAGLLAVVGLFGASVLSGSSLLALATVIVCAALLIARIGVLNGPAELRAQAAQIAAAVDAALLRWRPQQQESANAAAAPDSSALRRESNASFSALLQRMSAPQVEAGGAAFTLWQTLTVAASLAAFGVPLMLRAYRLADFQAEPYGDINIVFESVQDILRGNWPFGFTLSSGPLYHYLIAPFVSLVGLDYLILKLASAAVSVGVLWFTYRTGRALIDHDFGLLSVFIAGVSSWLLIFSRLGNSQIIVPLLTTASLWAAARYLRSGRAAYLVVCGMVGALGLYGYPQSFIVAPVMLVTLLVLKVCGHRVSWRALGMFVAAAAFVAVPFVFLLAEDAGNVTGAYIFDKIKGAEHPFTALATNFANSMGAFHLKGDSVFRSNPRDMPHLDVVSGLFMLVGIAFWLRKDTRRWFPLTFVPFLLLQAPAMLVVNFAAEVPSASRTLGVAPIAYLWAASGVWWAAMEMRRRMPRGMHAAGAFVAVALIVVTQANVQRYFVDYGDGLPYGNTPIARTAVNFLDTLPAQTNAYLFHCCWEGGMPEPKSIQFDMHTPRQLVEITEPTLTCDTLDSRIVRPAVLLWDFHNPLPDPNLQPCMQRLPAQLHVAKNGRPVFYSAIVLP